MLVSLDKPVILGRKSGTNSETFLDLNHLNAHQHGVSREHCKLQRNDNRLIITDLGSTNGTYLNGKALIPFQDHIVAHGDEFIIGTLHLMITFSTLTDDNKSDGDVLDYAPPSNSPLM
ncbi:MAG: FHA domain-containing protein [Anaerolineae bacterium]|nr:FHA domain-containing protein [Anaerolineae bacterium]